MTISDHKPKPNFATNRHIMEYCGCIFDGRPINLLISIMRLYCISSGWIQYLIGIQSYIRENEIMKTVECLHWFFVYLSVNIMIVNSLLRSRSFLKMEALVKSGFYDYRGKMNKKQSEILEDMDKIIRTVTFYTCIVFAFALAASYMKAPLFMEHFALPYPIWYPWEVNSWPRYLPTMAHLFFLAESMVSSAGTQCLLFVTLGGHLEAEIRSLHEGIRTIDDEDGVDPDFKIKSCVQHQLIIIDFFTELQGYYNVPLLTTAFAMGMILCTLGYIIISPDSNLPQIASFITVLVPEMCVLVFYSVVGQRIADASLEIADAVYNSEWYSQPVSVQKNLLLLMIGSRKHFQCTGFGLHEYSFLGLSEIIKASFTYFNMLVAFSGER